MFIPKISGKILSEVELKSEKKFATKLHGLSDFTEKDQKELTSLLQGKKTSPASDIIEENPLTFSLNKLSSLGSPVVKKHNHLYNYLQEKLHLQTDIREFVSHLPEGERYVGSLPDNWKTKFRVEDIPDKTKKVQKILSIFATEAYSIQEYGKRELRIQMAMLSDRLSEIFNEAPKISFVGSGNYGKVFRIQCANEDLALKIYHSDSDAYNSFNHGNLKEIGNAIALNHAEPNKCSRFYCAKLSDDSEEGAFMLTEFVSDDKPNVAIKLKQFVLGDSEKCGNIKGGKIIDYGAIYDSAKN